MSNKETVQNSIEKIKSALGHLPRCPICNNNNWNVAENIGITGTFDPKTNNVNPASGMPSVSMVCKNCSFIASFNPKNLGVI